MSPGLSLSDLLFHVLQKMLNLSEVTDTGLFVRFIVIMNESETGYLKQRFLSNKPLCAIGFFNGLFV